MNTSELQTINPDCKYHVLIVEDDLCLKTVLGRILLSIDRNVSYTWVTSAEQAQLTLMEMKISIIIADIGLVGNGTGMDLWEYCQKQFPDLPFLMVSGLGIGAFLELVGPRRQAPTFLPKPFHVGECRKLVEGLLRKTGVSRKYTRHVPPITL